MHKRRSQAMVMAVLLAGSVPMTAFADGSQIQVSSGLILIESGDTFGLEAELGDQAPAGFVIRNLGDDTLVLNDQPVSLTGPHAADFSVGTPNLLIQPGGFGVLGVSFAPSDVGERLALLTLHTNDPGFPQFEIQLSGVGVEPARPVVQVRDLDDDTVIANDDVYDLGVFLQTDDETYTLVVDNMGTADLKIVEVFIEGGLADDIEINGGDNVIVPPGDGEKIVLTYKAAKTGQLNAKLRIINNSADDTYTVRLTSEVAVDCNENGFDDRQELNDNDCDDNGVPDDCQRDTDDDGVMDECDACPGQDDFKDSDQNGEPDCLQQQGDNDGGQDPQDPNAGEDESQEQDGNEADQVELIEDCNFNGRQDADEIADGEVEDCDENGVPDPCQDDTDRDDVIDACDQCPGEDDFEDLDDNGEADCLQLEVFQPNPSMCGAGLAAPLTLGLLLVGGGRRRRPCCNRASDRRGGPHRG